MAKPEFCIDTLGAEREEPIGIYPCKDNLEKPGYRQNFRLRNHRDIYIEDTNTDCFDFNHGKVLLYSCKFLQDNQYFRYDLDTKQIFCGRKRDNKCIELNLKKQTLNVSPCDAKKITQKWKWGFVNETMLRNWADFGKPILDKVEALDFKTRL